MLKSPIYRTGNKYKNLDKILSNLPDFEINKIYDVFGGSGVVAINVPANEKIYNEFDERTYQMMKMIKEENVNLIERVYGYKNKYHETDKQFFEYTKKRYNETKDVFFLWICSFMSFSNDLRFNAKGEMNNPFGHRMSEEKLKELNNLEKVNLENKDFRKFLWDIYPHLAENDFVFLDPPYLQSSETNKSSYSNVWTLEDEKILLNLCGLLLKKNIKFMITNTISNKGETNDLLVNFIRENNLYVHELNSENFANGIKNKDYQEVMITNYPKKYKQNKLF